MSNTKSLSDLWRENRSKDPGTDLASILDGAKILSQSLIPNSEVVFSGVDWATTDKKRISLSPRILGDMDEFPVPGDKVDILLGLTVHEMGHMLFSPNKKEYEANLASKAYAYTQEDRQSFHDLVSIFEDIYIDHIMVAYPGYGDYLKRQRRYALGIFNTKGVEDALGRKCARREILNALVYMALSDGGLPQNITEENLETIRKLITNARKMCSKKISKQGAIINAWNILKQVPVVVEKPPAPIQMPSPIVTADEEGEPTPIRDRVSADVEAEQEAQEELEEREEPKDELGEAEQETRGLGLGAGGDGEEKPDEEPEEELDLASKLDSMIDDKTELPAELVEELTEAIVEKRDDLSQLISAIATETKYTILAYTPDEDAERTANARSKTSAAEEKLRRILQDFRLRRTKDYRGLMSGRISSRRLHRVGYGDQRVFQRRERPEEIDMVACVLTDLSGSVRHQRDLIEEIIVAMCDAFQKEKVEFIALGYSDEGRKVAIPRLYDKETGKVNLKLEKEWCNTPSYEGLAVAMAQLLRLGGKKQKVLFHYTDGHPNSANSPIIPELLQNIKSQGIADIHICLAKPSIFTDAKYGECMKEIYGQDVMFIDDVDLLPDIVDKELRKRLGV